MKVLHVINWLKTGGSENLLTNHVCELVRTRPDIENVVCVLGSRATASAEMIARLPVAPEFLEADLDYRKPHAALKLMARLRAAISSHKPDIVHSYLWTADVFSTLASGGLPVARVCHVLDRRGYRSAGNLKERTRVRATGRLLNSASSHFVAVSDACRDHAIENYRVSPKRIVTAHNGIDPARFSRGARGFAAPLQFGGISRLAPEKGLEHLVDAFGRFAGDYEGAQLTIAGGGPELDTYRKLVRDTGLAHCITLPGRVESAAQFYREIDALVVPSVDAEGLPTTILEAMASGLPVIATDIGGAREAIRHETDGMIVPAGDAAALATAMSALQDAPERARQMGEAGRIRVEKHFTVSEMTARIVENVYPAALELKAAAA